MKSNIHKKATFEDKFSRRYACWKKNNNKAWRREKKRNQRQYRRLIKEDINHEDKD